VEKALRRNEQLDGTLLYTPQSPGFGVLELTMQLEDGIVSQLRLECKAKIGLWKTKTYSLRNLTPAEPDSDTLINYGHYLRLFAHDNFTAIDSRRRSFLLSCSAGEGSAHGVNDMKRLPALLRQVHKYAYPDAEASYKRGTKRPQQGRG